ncbi:MAG TPA: spermidine/putrescine ABC transporter permease PotC [Candidatus Competibacteraceae bacterium]|nr:MAG: spermidine/putrescine ABC transporter permease PotC [Candidatus Competibacteraceae bacterium]HNW77963.1 spermidine/putrescine ABC transporter permease PotC [Candidatus Competibacteraceae bacterium]HQC73763.1 spermidine/putrescine ABC transporter permease PotC [Candidatus Competibacteraceae bacterium]
MSVKRAARIAYLLLIYGFLYLPILVLVVYSFNDSKYSLEWRGLTWDWYQALLDDPDLWQVALNSALIATLSATVATVIGTMAAVALYRYRFFGKTLLNGLVFVLMLTPDIVMGIALLILFTSLSLPLGFWTLLLAHITFSIPFVVVSVLSRISGFDRYLIEAAKDLGASEFQTFRRVLLPMLAPAVLAGWLLSFTLSMDDVMVSFFVTGPSFEILPLKIYSMVRLGVTPEINALCTLMLGVTLSMVLVAQALLRDRGT